MRIRRQPDAGDDAALAAVAFAVQWLPYGGADSYEVFTTFGLTPPQFAQRLLRALDTPEVVYQARLSPEVRGQLRDDARRMTTVDWPAGSVRPTSSEQRPGLVTVRPSTDSSQADAATPGSAP